MNDSIDEFFEREREAVPLLAPPSGRFEELQHVARRRRNRNTTAVSVAAAVVVAVAGTGTVLANLGHGTSNNAVNPASSTVAVSPSAAAPTTSPTATMPVPQGFQAWSVSFVHSGVDGYALGGYPCHGGQSCLAVVETTDSMSSWHMISEPGFSSEYGVNATNAIIRFAKDGVDGWMVGSEGVWSTHDTGRTWQPISALRDAQIDALESWGDHQTYAVGKGSDSVWISTDPTQDSTWSEHSFVGLGYTSTARDNLQADDKMVAVTRTSGSHVTVAFSGDKGGDWSSVPSPCDGHGNAAPVFALVDEHIKRFVCGDGSVYGYKDDQLKPRLARFSLPAGAHATSVATDGAGTLVAYSGAGIWAYVGHPTPLHVLANADVGYVGLTSDRQGIALPATPSATYWVTVNGGINWLPRSWN